MQNGIHVSIKKLLVLGGLKEQYPRVVFISCYKSGQPFAGILHAVKFRLFSPSVFIIFFSFYTRGQLHSKDRFGVLALEGTEFIQLPCCKEKLVHAAEKHKNDSLNIDAAKWQKFSQYACKQLLREQLDELKHGNKFDLGNKVLNPLRIACVNMQSSSKKSADQSLLKSKLKALKIYTELPEIAELLALANVCKEPNDQFLQTMKDFSAFFTKLADWNDDLDKDGITNLISTIDRLNNIFRKIKSY